MRLRRFMRFALTGVLNTLVHALVVALFYSCILEDAVYANGLGFLVATLLSYRINTRWTFKMDESWPRLARFLGVSTLGLGITLTVSALAERAGLGVVFGTLGVVLVLPPFTFLLHRFWTFGCKENGPSPRVTGHAQEAQGERRS